MHWTEINGWFSERDARVYQELVSEIKNGTILEVGSYLGRSVMSIAEICRKNGTTVWCVDPWQEWKQNGESLGSDQDFDKFFKNTIENRDTIKMFRQDSKTAFAYICHENERYDLIFIDGLHDYENVRWDIENWMTLLKPGGVIAGHDYHGGAPGVVQAVDELIPNRIARKYESDVWFSPPIVK